jgi:hypothetical protein
MINQICTNAAETFNDYKDDTKTRNILLIEIVGYRNGLEILAKTYEGLNQPNKVILIKNSIFILDQIINDTKV